MKKYEEYKSVDLPWLSEIPAHWDLKRSKSIFDVINERSKEGLEELLSVSSKHGVVKRSNIDVTMFKAESYKGYKVCHPDDLVINSLWAWQYGLGISKFKGIVSTAYGVYRLKNKDDCFPRFFNYLYRGTDYHWEMRVRSKGIWKSRYQLHDSSFLSMLSIIPPYAEQEKIVKFLDWKISKINKYIKAKKRQIELLKELKQAEINRAVTKGLDPTAPMKDSGIDWIGEIPDKWSITGIKHCIEQTQSGFWGDDPKDNENDMICIRIADFDYFNFTIKNKVDYTVRNYKSKPHRDLILKKDDILIEKSGGGDKTPVGRAVRYNQTDKALYANFIEKVSVKNSFDSAYFVYFLSALYNKGVIWKYIKQTTGLQNLDIRQFFSSEKVTLPSFDTQIQIGKYLDTYSKIIYKATTEVIRQISVLEEYKTKLISDIVTGKIDVRDIEVPEHYETEETVQDDIEEAIKDLENIA